MTPQRIQILRHLAKGKSITALGAFEHFGCLRLSERIREIEREGHKIDHKMVKLANGKRVCRYSIRGLS